MALFCCHRPLTSLPSPSIWPSPPLAVAAASVSRLPIKPINLPPTSLSHFAPLSISKRGCYLSIRAASDVDGVGPTADGAEPPPESKEEAKPVDKLPLESKLQERMEQKMRMKMAKKIRLRRKRLMRKRHMRKKGRWPLSKMKKLKNV
ncbi:hypothetical protein CRG98_020704 [Punica granatum]|uniref:50S ribosomal protein 5, chloroplastic n=1 Tax=Punica granatum TaxID=22663 RepID=A0A2I0JRM8_PUNGR|nr:hypothetical protein CRG98_020704 [Punica granatum]